MVVSLLSRFLPDLTISAKGYRMLGKYLQRRTKISHYPNTLDRDNKHILNPVRTLSEAFGILQRR